MAAQIVVGYDGSENSDRALDWAVREAAATAAPLRVVVSMGRPVAVDPSLYGPFLEAIEEEADKVAATAVGRAREQGVEAVAVVERGDAAGVLVEESRGAAVLAVGRRGRHGVRGRLGSVSAAVAAHAACPVVVLPEGWDPGAAPRPGTAFDGRVVVGVDRLGRDNPAVQAAARWAEDHGLGLVLLTVIPEALSMPTASADLDRAVREQLVGPAQAMVDQVAAAVRADRPGLDVTTAVLSGAPTERLVDAGRPAALLVVGSRGYGGFRGLLMGSVSQAVLNDGRGPVMVVPSRRKD
ncbi:universal stress protein [Kocuria flava]|uniref:Universal stress protein n=1 Tax=Kocuria flava TaxID=446860 RepID=A0A0U2NWU7_9MICC|nr:universal stress protein [Kocuria flava]ALU38685.1 universal stress protein [Kocuria flava]GEO91190.1 universal stress protein UspA [Kocuria flava]